MALLEISDLRTTFHLRKGLVHAVDGVSFSLNAGETVGVVGESGCGKSVTALSIMGLVPDPPGRITNGSILLDGEDLCAMSERKLRTLRGAKMSMIFQEPMTSLNPVYTVGNQISEVLRLHQGMTRHDAEVEAGKMLGQVGIPDPHARLKTYPHALSGGMRQRVMIAMALACKPQLLIADEPTTALDVTIQAQILQLLRHLQDTFGMAILLISHDLGVMAELAHRVMVMYAGRIVERATMEELYSNPQHPYTRALYAGLPSTQRQKGGGALVTIPGQVPHLDSLTTGCTFRERCALADQDCAVREPDLKEMTPEHDVRCIHTEHHDGTTS